ncbi:MAG: DinB family protein [Bacteroidota bacterium]
MNPDPQFLPQTVTHLRSYTDRVTESIGLLTEAQCNWRPNPEVWSLGLILEHLITANRAYFPVLAEIGQGTYKMKFWTRISPLSGVLGRSMIQNLGPNTGKKYTAPPAFRPRLSQVTADIVPRYREMHTELIALLEALNPAELSRLRIASPASGFITYSLRDALRIVDVHEARHLQQAERLQKHPDFPH